MPLRGSGQLQKTLLLTHRVFSCQAFSFLGLSFSICQNEELELESLAFKVLIRGPLWAAAG